MGSKLVQHCLPNMPTMQKDMKRHLSMINISYQSMVVLPHMPSPSRILLVLGRTQHIQSHLSMHNQT